MPDHLMIPPAARAQIAVLPDRLRKQLFEVILLLLENPQPPGSEPYDGVADMWVMELDDITLYYNALGVGTIIVQQIVIND
ncbi:hypothetical protein [Spongiactinospora sp. TRM90649]|uniref:hypothetical protein n=1 Tax=Spongiactinospora sp. TRM90649 TaxID=3031114 RepID=UPI0023F6D454|nr:hypothetical protein [Spongiactinospora sp. TRM90649]MDF5759266.1 hypothetical protein [Spongiactinospora sp. TRM90649]